MKQPTKKAWLGAGKKVWKDCLVAPPPLSKFFTTAKLKVLGSIKKR